jgi:hypothetical protein
MQALVNSALEEVALEGKQGECSVLAVAVLPRPRRGRGPQRRRGSAAPPSRARAEPAAIAQRRRAAASGCRVTLLWQRLEALLPLGGVTALNDGIKQYVWEALTQRGEDVRLCSPPEGGDTT